MPCIFVTQALLDQACDMQQVLDIQVESIHQSII